MQVEKIQKSLEQLPWEPDVKDPNATTIIFWTKKGQISRRFLKTHKIKSLYDFVISLGTDAGFESSDSQFEIMQNFPKVVFDNL